MGNFINAKAITFFDIETTNLDPKKSAILEITIITDWDDGTQDIWTSKIKPKNIEMEFADQEALNICGYNEEDWKNAPSFNDVAEIISKKISWGPVVAHNIQFDLAHLTSVFKRYGYRECNRNEKFNVKNKMFKIPYPIIDTCAMAYLFIPAERQNLNELRKYFNIEIDRAHNSLTDTEDCRHVFYHIINNTVGEN